jgi:Acyclic terpene utilisation family protein AtuA
MVGIMARRPVRIGNFSGYLGDRYTALDEVMAGDPVDVLMGDYLAEITLAALAARARADPARGYVAYAADQIRPHLPAIAGRGIRVVTNAGGLNPAGLAGALREMIAGAGLGLAVAHVEGDDVLGELAAFQAAGHALEHLDTGAPLKDWGARPIAANAYLGGWGIAAALRAGADIVVTGRVADASLTAGPAAWWHGWAPGDWDALAGAVTAGHVIECGPHATGGNFSGFTQIPGMTRPGFPVAEVAADGSSVITKHRGHGGAVTVDTVTAQLLYEIQGPRYLNPDVTAHLDTVTLAGDGPDRVAISAVRGSPPPPTAKVALFAPIGYEISQMLFATAPDVAAKVALLRAQLTQALGGQVDDLEITPLGVPAADPASQWEATVPVRVIATAATPGPLRAFGPALGSLYLSSYPGFHHDGGAQRLGEPWPRIDYWPALLPAGLITQRAVTGDGTVLEVPAPPAAEAASQPAHPEPPPAPWPASPRSGAARMLPLGALAHARSGDKGGNANVGIWVRHPDAWEWLRGTLSTAVLRDLVPEARDLEIVRHEFPHLRAVHVVLRGLLGTGGSSNLRVDQPGKAVGEYLRSRLVPVPEDLLPGALLPGALLPGALLPGAQLPGGP